jgi:hypothetical protein
MSEDGREARDQGARPGSVPHRSPKVCFRRASIPHRPTPCGSTRISESRLVATASQLASARQDGHRSKTPLRTRRARACTHARATRSVLHSSTGWVCDLAPVPGVHVEPVGPAFRVRILLRLAITVRHRITRLQQPRRRPRRQRTSQKQGRAKPPQRQQGGKRPNPAHTAPAAPARPHDGRWFGRRLGCGWIVMS